MKLITTLFLAAASSLVAQAAHHHAHRHQHKRDIVYKTVVSPDTVFVYQLDGEDIPVSEVCDGIKDGKYKWADGTAPAGACTPTSSATSVTAAVFFEVTSSTTSTSTTTSSTTTSSTTTTTPTPTSTSTTHTTSPAPSTTSKTTTSVAPSTSQQPSTSSGGVTIKNSMGQTIYLWSTSNVAGTMVTVPVGGTYAETWELNPDLGGISIKVATTTDESDVLQFEYTLVGDTIWWDVSLINLELNLEVTSLFDKLGFTVTPDTSNCRAVTCPPGDTQCSDAYLFPSDDQATRSCVATTNMVLNLGP